jgi:lysine 2,3-aminomutase
MPAADSRLEKRGGKMASPWGKDVRDGIRGPGDVDRFPLTDSEKRAVAATSQQYAFRAPASYTNLIDWTNPNDPIRLQVVPSENELHWHDGELADPIGDRAFSPVARITHRYPDRVLLYPTYHCAVYCRHCFRKESLAREGFSRPEMAAALSYISSRPEIAEVILTGGDPLLLSDSELEFLRNELEAVNHVRMIRFHTRIPVVMPRRITPDFIRAIKSSKMTAIVTHFNHPNEISAENASACAMLREAGFLLLNQTVLLKGVNDNADTLRTLFTELLYRLGCKPYYLHHCDLTRGLEHFRTDIERGRRIVRELRGTMSGLAMPEYILDIPGGFGKIPIGPVYVNKAGERAWTCKRLIGSGAVSYTDVVSAAP